MAADVYASEGKDKSSNNLLLSERHPWGRSSLHTDIPRMGVDPQVSRPTNRSGYLGLANKLLYCNRRPAASDSRAIALQTTSTATSLDLVNDASFHIFPIECTCVATSLTTRPDKTVFNSVSPTIERNSDNGNEVTSADGLQEMAASETRDSFSTDVQQKHSFKDVKKKSVRDITPYILSYVHLIKY